MNNLSIEINDLNKKYNNVLAVKNINFKINKGSIVCLLGPNFCGKTTTIGMLLGLIKPTSGNVFVNGGTAVYQGAYDDTYFSNFTPEIYKTNDDIWKKMFQINNFFKKCK